MKTMSRMIVLVLLQLALVSIDCTTTVKCGSYMLVNKRSKDLYVRENGWTSEPIRGNEKMHRISVERKCLLFVGGAVYEPAVHTIDRKVPNVQCCCEWWNSPHERFLNRHVIQKVPTTWNDDMKGRCIPIGGRLIQTFIVSTPAVLKEVCGTQGMAEKFCMSKTKLTLYSIERKADGHYTNNQTELRQLIVVTCKDLLPIHFQCIVGDPGCDKNRYHTCN